MLLLARRWLYAELGLHQPDDLARLCMAADGLLAENDSITGLYLEASAAGRDQFQGADGIRKEIENFARQTEGSRGVVSLHAVFDAEIELIHVASFARFV